MISTRSVGLLIDTVVCLTLAKWETVSGRFGGYLTKAIVEPKRGDRWLLVTSAYHMPRAIGVFRKAGFPVEPYPVSSKATECITILIPESSSITISMISSISQSSS
jgi:DUF218 domain